MANNERENLFFKDIKERFSSNQIKANTVQFRRNMVVLGAMVSRNIKTQYRRSVLGILWTMLAPLLNMIVLTIVFSRLFGRNNINMDYPIYVLSGNIVFTFMRVATSTALTSLVDNYDMMMKTRIEYEVFPISKAISSMVNFGFSCVALIIVMLVRILQHVENVGFHWSMLLTIVPWLPFYLLFVAGISLILSVIYVRFRDIKHIYTVVLTLWTYLTPLFYSLDSLHLSDTVMTIMKLNPMYYYVTFFREIIQGQIPSLTTQMVCYGCGVVMFIIGWVCFRLAKKRIILYI
ncbi:MAG: ABC transporter permease [Clostridia bacterium]|nr:ABC transporter permease [Clostridia bacterium]